MSESKARLLVKLINNLDSTGDIKPEGIAEGIDADLDSANVFSLIDSAHLLSKVDVSDSNYILSLTNSDYIQERVTLDGVGIDSSAHFQLIDSDYLLQRAGTSSGITQASFLNVVDGNYIRTKANLQYDRTGIDSDAVLELSDSAYIVSKYKVGTDSAAFLSAVDSDYLRLKTQGVRGNSSFNASAYDSIDLLPLTADSGSFAFIKDSKKVYIRGNSSWISIATLNENPSYVSGIPVTHTFGADSTSTTYTMIASDPDTDSAFLEYTYNILSGSDIIDSVTVNGNQFIITPSLTAGDATIKFGVNDGQAYSFASSILSYVSLYSITHEWDSASSQDTILNSGSRSDLMGYNNMGSTDEGNFVVYSENDIAYMHYHNGTSWSSATSVSGGTNSAYWGTRVGGSESGNYFVVTTGDISGNLFWWKVDPANYATDFTSGNRNNISNAAGAASYLESHDCWTDGNQKIFMIAGGPRSNTAGSRAGEAEIHYSTNAGTSFSSITITSPNAETDGFFGQSVAINDNICVVGAPYEDVSINDRGRVYIYKTTNNWASASLIATFDGVTHGDNINYHSLGQRCDIANNKRVIVCGAYGANNGIKVFDPNDIDDPTSYSLTDNVLDNLELVEPLQIASHGKQIICTRNAGSANSNNQVYILRDDDGTWSIDAVLQQSDQSYVGQPYSANNCSATINGSFAVLGDFCSNTYPNGRIYVWNGTAV